MRLTREQLKTALPLETWLHPVIITDDRYDGCYVPDKHRWIAICQAFDHELGESNLDKLSNGALSDDVSAMNFWTEYVEHPDQHLWVATGKTPDEAHRALVEKNKP